MNYQPLIDLALSLGCTVTQQAPMAEATTFRIGGPADLLIDLPGADPEGTCEQMYARSVQGGCFMPLLMHRWNRQY